MWKVDMISQFPRVPKLEAGNQEGDLGALSSISRKALSVQEPRSASLNSISIGIGPATG